MKCCDVMMKMEEIFDRHEMKNFKKKTLHLSLRLCIHGNKGSIQFFNHRRGVCKIVNCLRWKFIKFRKKTSII